MQRNATQTTYQRLVARMDGAGLEMPDMDSAPQWLHNVAMAQVLGAKDPYKVVVMPEELKRILSNDPYLDDYGPTGFGLLDL